MSKQGLETNVIKAFLRKEPSRVINNTHTDGQTLYLHGNAIARHAGYNHAQGDTPVSAYEVSLAGWDTVTTRNRIQALLNMIGSRYYIHRVKGEPRLTYRDTNTHVVLDINTWYLVD